MSFTLPEHPFDTNIAEALAQREARHLLRQHKVQQSACGRLAQVDGRTLLNFCSNDYLGLASDARVTAAFVAAAQQWGVGAGASHLVCGHTDLHQQLQQALAEFTGREAALLFSTGYMANMGIIQALCGRGDAVFEDRLNHASLIDGGLYSGATLQRYRHNDRVHLQELLSRSSARKKLIVSDAVFSMDGDLAPLPELAALAQQHEAWLMLDDAHGLGVLGARGAGCCEHFGLSAQQVPVLMGTLGKAFGAFGAFVAGSSALIDFLRNEARTAIYTTATPPAVAAAALAALQIIRQEPERRQHLQQLIAYFRAGAEELGLSLMPSHTPIQPVIVGDAERALKLSAALEQRGVLVMAIRPPTVPAGTARLRITLSAVHTRQDVALLLQALADAAATGSGA